ncbi:MAG: hypothetical protein IJS61_05220 [Firmicutes bacterium]|nr:hypothetical protein [Bacillota bacterium]
MAFNLGSFGGGGSGKLKRDIDFIKAYKDKGGSSVPGAAGKGGKAAGGFALNATAIKVIAGVCGVFAVWAVALIIYALILEGQVKASAKDTESIRGEYDKAIQNEAVLNNYTKYNNLTDQIKKNIKSYPKVTLATYDAIKNVVDSVNARIPGTMKITAVSYSNGVLTYKFKTTSTDTADIGTLVEAIRMDQACMDEYSYIGYTGYTSTNDNDDPTLRYGFDLACEVKVDEEEEAPVEETTDASANAEEGGAQQ